MNKSINVKKVRYGDFQTPTELAHEVCNLLIRNGLSPTSIVEPTCGTGAFVRASFELFMGIEKLIGLDINEEYVIEARSAIDPTKGKGKIELSQSDFFQTKWTDLFAALPGEILVLGNLPWVTSAGLGAIGGGNLPGKTNFKNFTGLEARTGKANFDISEWMLIRLMEELQMRTGWIAILCKSAVARKVIHYAWTKHIDVSNACIYRIDSKKAFGVSVDACLFVLHVGVSESPIYCAEYSGLESTEQTRRFGLRNGQLVADIEKYEAIQELDGRSGLKWRSGIKHDCAQVMELTQVNGDYVNGYGEIVDVEPEYIFPLLKSSDLARKEANPDQRKWVIVTQKAVKDDTKQLAIIAPRLWEYLCRHELALSKRGSSLYAKSPRFSIFGVGNYTFSAWKIAISGLYKTLSFKVVGPVSDKPTLFDDTCYFIPFDNEHMAKDVLCLLNSGLATDFLQSMIFWDSKRPITAEVLNRLDLVKLASLLGRTELLMSRDETVNSQISMSLT